ncbi:type ISP restriction/modification enzyme [Helicobacter himalayensis]|uniref:type ISP restriction/modification enzyme n=1 Tax=Helicobacter TaxID=209 RepID=UPI001F2BD29A|nr:type ISP restriction/modification enzyme [Helicobacter turcicus]
MSEKIGAKIGEALFKDKDNRNLTITKPKYNEQEQRLFVNDSLYFDKVSKEVWEYKIGGYAVLDKYLKSHKGEEIDYKHFEKVIQSLHKSLEIEFKISKITL